jgi:hypothetical protein
MVQNKNFQANTSKKGMANSQDLDRKNQTADRSADSARTGSSIKDAGLSKDKSSISTKRDVNSRK